MNYGKFTAIGIVTTPVTRKSRVNISGFFVFVMGCLVSWKSRGQKNVTLSLTKAKYVAIFELCAELSFVRLILEFLGKKDQLPNYFLVQHCWSNIFGL